MSDKITTKDVKKIHSYYKDKIEALEKQYRTDVENLNKYFSDTLGECGNKLNSIWFENLQKAYDELISETCITNQSTDLKKECSVCHQQFIIWLHPKDHGIMCRKCFIKHVFNKYKLDATTTIYKDECDKKRLVESEPSAIASRSDDSTSSSLASSGTPEDVEILQKLEDTIKGIVKEIPVCVCGHSKYMHGVVDTLDMSYQPCLFDDMCASKCQGFKNIHALEGNDSGISNRGDSQIASQTPQVKSVNQVFDDNGLDKWYQFTLPDNSILNDALPCNLEGQLLFPDSPGSSPCNGKCMICKRPLGADMDHSRCALDDNPFIITEEIVREYLELMQITPDCECGHNLTQHIICEEGLHCRANDCQCTIFTIIFDTGDAQ